MSKSDDTYFLLETPEKKYHPHRPSDIPNLPEYDVGLLNTFGKAEVEKSAARLVHFFVHRGCWCGFTLDELREFYELKGWGFKNPFFGLSGLWFDDGGLGCWREPAGAFIGSDSEGTFCITSSFVEHCMKAASRG